MRRASAIFVLGLGAAGVLVAVPASATDKPAATESVVARPTANPVPGAVAGLVPLAAASASPSPSPSGVVLPGPVASAVNQLPSPLPSAVGTILGGVPQPVAGLVNGVTGQIPSGGGSPTPQPSSGVGSGSGSGAAGAQASATGTLPLTGLPTGVAVLAVALLGSSAAVVRWSRAVHR